MNPFEYHDNKLGVQGCFLIDGRNAADGSMRLISDRGLRKKIERGQLLRLCPQGPGRPMLVLYASLPPAWQRMLLKEFGNPPEQAYQTWCEKLYKRDLVAFKKYTEFNDESGYLLPDKVEEYTLNASVLNLAGELYAHRYEYRKSLRGLVMGDDKIPSVRESIAADIARFRSVVKHTLPENASRLFEKYRLYKREGYTSLIHGNRGNNNARVVTVDIDKLLNDMFATQTHKPTATEIYGQYMGFLDGQVEVINNETGEVYNPSLFAPLSQGSVSAYLAKWRNRIGTHAMRSGNRQDYMKRFKPYHTLEQPKFAGSIISVDDRQPPFEYEKGRRMWFYNGIDVGSEAFTTWVWGKSKEGIILDFYRQMVRNYAEWGFNLPAEIEAESSLNSSFRETFLQEGAMFQYVRIEANNARGKRIEAYYRPLRYNLEKKSEGWLARPFAMSEANQTGAGKIPIIPYDQLVQARLRDIETWNNMEHSKIKGKSRWEVFCEMQHPDIQPTNYRAIIPYLGYTTKTSCQAGIINLQKAEFLLGQNSIIATGEKLITLMDRIEGRDIDVYWLDGNDGRVLKAYAYIGQQYICEVIAKPGYNRSRIEQADTDLVNRELMSKYVASIEGYGRRRRAGIDRVTVIDNRDICINHKFVMPGLSQRIVTEHAPAEVIEEPDFEQDLMPVETGFNRSLKDRF